MRQALYHYCVDLTPLEIFGVPHLITLLVGVAIVFSVPWLSRKYLDESAQQRLGRFIGWLTFSGYAFWAALHLIAGSFDLSKHLPMHLCFVVGVLTPVAMTWRNQTVFEFVYYCGFSGVLQACISPAEVASYPHFDFFRFWVLHIGVILSAVYAVVVYRMWPTAQGVFRTWLIVLSYLVVAIVVNLSLGTNYFYICTKPPKSLLDILGPWPWYVVVAIPLAYVLIGIGYIPIWVVERVRGESPKSTRLN